MLGTGVVVRSRRLLGALRTALGRHAGLLGLLRRSIAVLRAEGWSGIVLRWKLLFGAQRRSEPNPPMDRDGSDPSDPNNPTPSAPPDTRWRQRHRTDLLPGAVLVGHPYAVLGRGEDVRTGTCAFAAAAIPFTLRNTFGDYGKEMAVFQQNFPYLDRIDARIARKANVFYLNANEMDDAFVHLGANFFTGCYNIGYWAWELSAFPDAWLSAFRYVDEIWVHTRFIQQAVADKAPCPVLCMPVAVEPVSSAKFSRAYFGLPDDGFLVLFFFDFRSFIHRKNPEAALHAFFLAFHHEPATSAKLIIKVNGADARPDDYQAFLASEAVRDPRVILIDRIMEDWEITELVRLCDCFLSLHRSEGFGRGLAEAMYFGKPVIATGYSGNVDFMNEANSCLIDYTLIPVGADQYPYGAGQIWAEPDVEQAAWYLRRLVKEPEYAAEIGQRAAHYIQTYHSYAAIGARHRRRLEKLGLLG
ncbi:MAG: glycosyltransferase family 4 protein [Candidatus Competibacteraceae bacterium]|nr:glycosyltransferase family 4 protein [Candidatus Competibacteraceae bacterium]MBK8961488.1 glycosyltransferase family 4 protein [Candidatus Competibacteraceae bacterium]MBK9950717.1 glycosyltransferase family 4 protein [Candidatus Competibacteraceae bacterium]